MFLSICYILFYFILFYFYFILGVRNPKLILKLQAIYRQALYGDCTTEKPVYTGLESNSSATALFEIEVAKWAGWKKFLGTDSNTAKRR